MVDIFDGLTPEELGIKHVTTEVAENRSRLADQVREELRKAGLRACLGTIDDPSPGAKIEVESFEDGPAASVYWKCDPSVHGAFDISRPDGGPAFQYFVQAAGHVQTAVLAILRAAGFTVERDDQDPLALLILAGPSTHLERTGGLPRLWLRQGRASSSVSTRDIRSLKDMGYAISLHRFVDGEAETLDERVAREVLAPHAVNADQDDNELLVRAADGGEAEVNVSADGISVHRFPPGGILDIVAELADRLGAAIALPDSVLLGAEAQRADLPDGLRDMAVVVEMTGPGLQRALNE